MADAGLCDPWGLLGGGGVVGADDFVVSGEDVGAGSVLRLWTRLGSVGADDLVIAGKEIEVL